MPFVLAAGGTGEIGNYGLPGTNLTLNGTISGSGALRLVAGTLTLGGNNTFTGGVTIDAGTLRLANPGALNSTTPNSVTFGANSTGTLNLNGNSVTISGLSTNAAVGSPVVQEATVSPATLTVNNSVDNEYDGILQNGGAGILSLVKAGAGTLTLGGSN